MSLIRRLLSFIMFVALIPAGMEAQEQKGDIDFNIGISTPGLYSIADTENHRGNSDGTIDFYHFYGSGLSYLSKGSYISTLYPSVSAELSYRLADAGFFKRLSVVGYAGLHVADYQDVNVVSSTIGSKETAIKIDCLLGFRYHIIDRSNFNMYTQAFLGGEIKNGCAYWEATGDVVNIGLLGEKDIRWHLTFLGFRFKSKNSNVGLFTELGYGSEYCLLSVPIIPGVRVGASYLF